MGKPPPARELLRLALHHAKPAYRELMGKSDREAWKKWPKQGDGRDGWHGHSSAWSGKGHGKQGKWVKDEAKELFPTLEMMSVQAPSRGSVSSAGQQDDQDTSVGTGGYVKGVQKLLNGVRKAEARSREVEEDAAGLEAQWKRFQEGLQETFIKERTKYLERKRKMKMEAAEAHKQKDEALAELQVILADPHEIFKSKGAPPEDMDAIEEFGNLLKEAERPQNRGLSAALAGALLGGDARENMKAVIAEGWKGPARQAVAGPGLV